MGRIVIDIERCKGCEVCAANCPQKLIVLDVAVLNAQGYHPAKRDFSAGECKGCKICADMCPDVCIEVYK